MKRIVIFLIGIVVAGAAIAQNIDDQRMNRDLEVARNILSTLIRTESGSTYGGGAIEASYVEGYGVIFTIPRYMVFFRGPGAMAGNVMHFSMPDLVDGQKIAEEVQIELKRAQKEMEHAQKEMEHAQQQIQEYRIEIQRGEGGEGNDKNQTIRREIIVEAPGTPAPPAPAGKSAVVVAPDAQGSTRVVVNSGTPSPMAEVDWEKVILTFLGDYADLIGQLQPDQRIMVRQEKPFENWGMWTGEDGAKPHAGITAEVKKSDITAYKTGKINQTEFNKRVSIKKTEPQKKVADLEMFSNIMSRFFSPDLSETFFTEGNPGYEVLDRFGVVFSLNTYSSYVESGQFYMPMKGKRVMVSPEERREKIEALYPQFLSDLRNFVIDYGRTIRSIPDDEKLVLKVKLTKCDGCAIPKSLEVNVPMSTLRQFDQQKLSRDKALAAIEIKEL